MLRASTEATGLEFDATAIADPQRPIGLPAGAETVRFARALVRRTDDLDAARNALVESIGAEGAAGVAAVAGNFEMMNRVLDATGVPIPAEMAATLEPAGLAIDAIDDLST
ncbi:MAG: hypothetical protein AAGD35_10315 [Actinomycetota bacterium]